MTRRQAWKIAIYFALFGFALLVRWRAAGDFDGLYGQDAYAYYNFAAGIAQGKTPAPLFWPLGYPVILAGAFRIFGENAQSAQIVSLIMGAALAPILYALARELGIRRIWATFAGVLMAISGQAIQSSIVVMADIPALFWALVSAVCLAHYTNDSRRAHWLIGAAAGLAMACVTRWLYVALIPAYALCVLLYWRKVKWRETLLCLIAAGVILIPQLIYSAASPFPTFNHAWVQGWSLANITASEFVNVDGQFRYATTNAVIYAAPFYQGYYLAPHFAPFIVFGLLVLSRRRLSHAMLIGLWALIPYVFLAGIPYQNIRFGLILTPAAIVLALFGLSIIHSRVVRTPIVFQAAVSVGLAAVILSGAAVMIQQGNELVDQFVTNQMRDKQTVAWAVEQLVDDATVYTMGLTLPLQHDHAGAVRELYYETPASLNAAWVRGQVDYLLVNMWQIENQWAGRAPEIAVNWLRDRRGLTILAREGNYTLFRVGD